MKSDFALVIGLVVIVIGGCAWWLLSTSPTRAQIESAKRPVTPVPTINLQLLDGSLTSNKTTNGTLPIQVNPDATGRSDPFAGV